MNKSKEKNNEFESKIVVFVKKLNQKKCSKVHWLPARKLVKAILRLLQPMHLLTIVPGT